jgi:hypothetical protein
MDGDDLAVGVEAQVLSPAWWLAASRFGYALHNAF